MVGNSLSLWLSWDWVAIQQALVRDTALWPGESRLFTPPAVQLYLFPALGIR